MKPEHDSFKHEILKELHHFKSMGEKLMSIISDFAATQDAINAQLDSSLPNILNAIQQMLALIANLQNNAISPADQNLLNQLQAHNQNVSNQLNAINGLIPPAAPAP